MTVTLKIDFVCELEVSCGDDPFFRLHLIDGLNRNAPMFEIFVI